MEEVICTLCEIPIKQGFVDRDDCGDAYHVPCLAMVKGRVPVPQGFKIENGRLFKT